MKRYEELDITDNFMFAKVFSNEDVAKDFLQDVLKITIEKITVVAEASAQEDPFHKSVRFDVLVRENLEIGPVTPKDTAAETENAIDAENTVDEASAQKSGRYFDIELQMREATNLPKRTRYYQSMCDLDALAKGADYEELREQYILFICPDDIFGKGLSIYRFQNREESNPKILLGDLCYKNFYIFGKYDDIKDRAIREYMQYFATQKHESAKMKRIHELVEKYRQDPIARKAYMTLEQELNLRYKKGFKDGEAKGEAKGADAKNRELAKNFRDDGVPLEIISKRTGFTSEEINAL